MRFDFSRRFPRDRLLIYPMVAAAAAVILWLTVPAWPHQAPSGWTYSQNCCSGRDCAQAEAGQVEERPDGYHVSVAPGHHPMVKDVPFATIVAYGDTRIRNSLDEHFHICLSPRYHHADGTWSQRLLCLYVPPRLF